MSLLFGIQDPQKGGYVLSRKASFRCCRSMNDSAVGCPALNHKLSITISTIYDYRYASRSLNSSLCDVHSLQMTRHVTSRSAATVCSLLSEGLLHSVISGQRALHLFLWMPSTFFRLDRTSYHFADHDSVRSNPLGSEDFNTSKDF